MPSRPTLRLNQGDRSDSRIYYCAHFAAAELGFFADAEVDVAFVWADPAVATILGGQLPAVIDGSADLAIGGTMVVMRLAQQSDFSLAAFCAAAAANPWILVASRPLPGFTLADLAGQRVLDMAGIDTATLTFRWLLQQHGVVGVDLAAGSGHVAADIAVLANRQAAFGLHSLHALAPAVAEGRIVVVTDLARATGPVPWSAYIARRDRLAARAPQFRAFVWAIARAQQWIAEQDAAAIAALVAPHYPDYPPAALRAALASYKASGVFASTPLIARADCDRFARIMAETGWLGAPVPYEAVVEPDVAEAVAQERA